MEMPGRCQPAVPSRSSQYSMIAGNRRAGMLGIAFVVALLCLSMLAVLRAHWKTRQPVPQKSMTGEAFAPTFSYEGKFERSECTIEGNLHPYKTGATTLFSRAFIS